MKTAELVARVVAREFSTEIQLKSVEIRESEDGIWQWLRLDFTPTASPLLRDLHPVVALACPGELLFVLSERRASLVAEDCLPLTETICEPIHLYEGLACCPFLPSLDAAALPSCAIIKIRSDQRPLDADCIRRAIEQSTWMGGALIPTTHLQRTIQVRAGAQTLSVAPRKPTAPRPTIPLNCGVLAIVSPHDMATKPSEIVRVRLITPSGAPDDFDLDSDDFMRLAGVPLHDYYGFKPRFRFRIEGFIKTLPPSETDHREVFHKALEAATKHQPAVLTSLAQQSIKDQHTSTIQGIQERKRSLSRRRSVYASNPGGTKEFIGPEPSFETETLLIIGKLQPHLARYFSKFNLLEHTAKLGIDGLLQIRRDDDVLPEDSATVELEHKLGNFFTHEHPIKQVTYVICWTLDGLENGTHRYGRGGIHHEGPLEFTMSSLPSRPWMKILNFSDHIIYVIPLEKFPRLIFEPPH